MDKNLSPWEKAKTHRYWEFGRAMHDASLQGPLNPKMRREIAEQVSQRHGWTEPLPSPATLYRIAHRWETSNGTPLAQVPRHAAKGNRSPKLSPEVLGIMKRIIHSAANEPRQQTIISIWNRIRIAIEDFNSTTSHDRLLPPSYDTVRNHWRKLNNLPSDHGKL